MHPMFAPAAMHDCAELVTRDEVHQLREDRSTNMHATVPPKWDLKKRYLPQKVR